VELLVLNAKLFHFFEERFDDIKEVGIDHFE
jgi:hypothetical protein